jgi:hypothetical protein
MSVTLPDKWIRKAVSNAINNIVVDSVTIPCYDTYVTGEKKNAYVLMTTQTSLLENNTKCDDKWNSSILLDIFTKYLSAGNTGSRLFADNIADEVRRLTDNLVLDPDSDLRIIWQRGDFENDISSSTKNENVFRKLYRLEFMIQEA